MTTTIYSVARSTRIPFKKFWRQSHFTKQIGKYVLALGEEQRRRVMNHESLVFSGAGLVSNPNASLQYHLALASLPNL